MVTSRGVRIIIHRLTIRINIPMAMELISGGGGQAYKCTNLVRAGWEC